MSQYLDDEEKPEKPDDIDFAPYSVDYMFETGNLFVQYGTLPSGKGWNDEAADWIDALGKWLSLRRYLKHQRDNGNSTNGDALGEILSEVGAPTDWKSLMSG